MTHKGPGAIRWVPVPPEEPPRRVISERTAVLAGLFVGVVVSGAFGASRSWETPKERAPAPIPVTLELPFAPVEVLVYPGPAMEAAPPPQTWRAPYSHAAATGTLELRKGLGAPYAGVMTLAFEPMPPPGE